MPPKICDHDYQPTGDTDVVDGKTVKLYACTKCGQDQGWH